MSILVVENLSHSFGDRVIFEDVSFRLNRGEHVGLVGANGEGKSTFMNILTKKLEPEEGKVLWNKRVNVGYLDQHTVLDPAKTIRDVLKSAYDELYDIEQSITDDYMKMADMDEKEMNVLLEDIGERQSYLDQHDFYLIDPKIDEISRAFSIDALGLDTNVSNLSGGQRTRILMAKLLLQKPDILLLDEPTNYLDVEHIEWLKNYLINYENAFILISHDIPFLNTCINVVYHVDAPSITRYTGNYDNFVSVYETKKKQLEAAYNRQQAEIEKMEDFIARNKARVATRGMANSRMKQLNKMERIELKKEKIKPEFAFQYSSTPSKYLFIANDIVIGYDYPLSKPMTFTLEKNKKVAIVGANGIGKTTLLKSLLGIIDVLSGSIEHGENIDAGYFVQEEKASSQTCMQELWDTFPAYSQYEVRSALAKCGLTTEQIESQVFVLSGGEQAKLRLCKIMNHPCNLLVLDEPTNHLDQDAKDSLKEAIQAFKGTVLLVSHEPYFYEDIVDEVWDMSQYSI